MKLSDIKADDRNANKHSKTGMEMLDKSVKDNGTMLAEGQIFKKLKHNDKYRVHRTTGAE